MSTEFEIRNLLPRCCRLPFNRNLLTQITDSFLFSCAVAAVFYRYLCSNAQRNCGDTRRCSLKG